ncbi:alpha/beta hydrolase [Miniimonas arenae]|uniref:Alpha/beta hydrolase n=1 Tax=Miniimonas arenae TaxID=676201 RepID=A0A5C5BE27_9MICO|nr:alpha/beta hydrolase [Miniimonas arenae]TNU76252.1 alpha/beta hydrolase [Miniimonas arenae]
MRRPRLPRIPGAGDLGSVVHKGAAWAADYAWIGLAQTAALRPGDRASTLITGRAAPVLLLPGIYETWEVMAPLARALHDAGHPVHTVPGLGYNGATLPQSVTTVEARLRALDLRDAVLVAHSKGGLIGKSVLTAAWSTGRVAGLVAVNTPFGGSRLARWFPARAVRALSPLDTDIVALGRTVDTHDRIHSIYARFDPHVPDGSVLVGATNVELPIDGHFRVLASRTLHRAVVEAVATVSASAQRERERGEPRET